MPMSVQDEMDLKTGQLLSRKLFSDQLELESHLRFTLLSRPGQMQDIRLQIRKGLSSEVVFLDLQPR